MSIIFGSPGRARTSDIEINSFALLPTELLGNKFLADSISIHYLAVSVGFEPTARITTNGTLAGCWFKPLIQLTILTWRTGRGSNPWQGDVINRYTTGAKSLYNYTLTGIEPAYLRQCQGCNPLHQRGLRFCVYVYKDLLYTLKFLKNND